VIKGVAVPTALVVLVLMLGHSSADVDASSGTICDITVHGAKCDDVSDDSEAIQRLLDNTSCTVVRVPAPRKCVSRALNISRMSHRTLRIESGAELVLWRDVKSYADNTGGTSFSFISSVHSAADRWHGPLLSGFRLNGGGHIMGGGRTWWPYMKTIFRPRTLFIPNGTDLHISNLTFVDSPSWNMGIRAHNLLIEHMNISAGAGGCGGYYTAPNTDGFNIGGTNLTVRHSTVHNGDDCVPVTTYSAEEGTRDVLVQDVKCHCGTNGAVIYNQGGVVENVVFDGVTTNGTSQGLGVKIANSLANATGGLVRNITFRNMAIHAPRYAAMYTNVYDEDAGGCNYPAAPDRGAHWLTVRDVRVENVSARLAVPGQPAACFLLSPGNPATAWTFVDVRVVGAGGEIAAPYACHNVDNVTRQGENSPQPCV
jgi:hypothetical protein